MSRSIEEFQDTIRTAPSRLPLKIKGWCSWNSAYEHPAPSHNLSFAGYAGVQEYVPGNLTMTVRAGTTLAEIAEIAGAENQWLPLEPFGEMAGTIGATVATCSYGPLATGFGTPRDLVLGIEAILGTGEIVRGGGRVVKNVAGYDLSRLLTGSWGALGAISEVTLRLFAKQETESTVMVTVPDNREKARKVIQSIRSSAIHPWAMELLDSRFSSALGLPGESVLVMRFGGNENLVKSQVDSLPGAEKLPNEFWKTLAQFQHGWSMRVSNMPSRLFETWDAAAALIANTDGGYRTASPERGTVRVFFPSDSNPKKLFTALGQFSGAGEERHRIVVEAMPAVSPLTFSNRGAAHSQLSAGIKRVFDPGNILHPGLLQ